MITRRFPKDLLKSSGFTLIELILVIVIIGVLVGVAVQNGGQLFETAKIEETKQEMDALTTAITGNPELQNNGVRSDFGYVGDVGSMPPNLDALYSNPGGYATWKGPYIGNRFTQIADDYKKDAFGADYSYSGGATIVSTGSGSNIVRRIANATADLLYNGVNGNVFDRDGTPPGNVYADSVTIALTYPNGTGNLVTAGMTTDPGGYFDFDSIPIGNHDLQIIYGPANDTLRRFVSVTPNSSQYNEYRLDSNLWFYAASGSGGSDLQYVPGSAQAQTGSCDRIEFDITNTTGTDIIVTSMTLNWGSPTAYYEKIKFDGGAHVFDQNNPRVGSGDVVVFGYSKTVAAGATVTIRLEKFTDVATGNGNKVNMSNADMTATFSDGSVVTFNTGACP